MKAHLVTKISYFFLLVVGKLSSPLLSLLESQIQLALGKGSGGHSTKQEVQHLSQIWFEKFSSLPNPVILDIGGNIGDWASQAQKFFPESAIYVFEPSEYSFNVLKQKFLGARHVSLVQKALGDTTGLFPLYSDKGGSPLSSLVRRNLDFVNLSFDNEEEVRVVRLDDWSKESGIQPNILKLDIEGFELSALLGALKTIKNVQLIQFEFGGANRDSQTYFKNFWDFFSRENFLLLRVSPLGLIPITKYQEQDECFRTTNFIAVNRLFS